MSHNARSPVAAPALCFEMVFAGVVHSFDREPHVKWHVMGLVEALALAKDAALDDFFTIVPAFLNLR